MSDDSDLISLGSMSKAEQPELSGAAGLVIADKYRLDQVIGLGAMGTVWQATHLQLSQPVAVKLISKEYSSSREARHRFKVEATAAARLKSRFVVQVYDSGQTSDQIPYLVMELLEGETLEEKLAREGALGTEDAVRITAQVARGLGQAHEQEIIHRDLKPANIHLTWSRDDDGGYVAKVLDFGIAKLTDVNQTNSATRTGTVLGTPQFMSPEQVRGLKSLDRRTDIYALGMVAYHMLTGELAFDGEAFGDLLLTICTKDLPSIVALRPDLPPEVDEWFFRCCARSADQRYPSAEAAADALMTAAGLGGSLNAMVASTVSGLPSRHPPSVPPRPVADDLPTLRQPPDIPPLPPLPKLGGVKIGGTLNTSSRDITTGRNRGMQGKMMPLLVVAAVGALILTGIAIGVSGDSSTESPEQAPTPVAPARSPDPTPTATSPGSAEPTPAEPTAAEASAAPGPSALAPQTDAGVVKKPRVSPTWKGFKKPPASPDPDLGF